MNAYDKAAGGGMLEEFVHDDAELMRVKAHSELAGKLHTAMHEVIGHFRTVGARGGTPKETIQSTAHPRGRSC